jgi:hypothetical protein
MKHSSHRLLTALILLISSTGEALPLRPVEDAPPPFPEVAPIPLNEKAFLEKDFRAEERVWAQRLLLKPALEAWKDQPWAQEATVLIEAALELRATEFSTLHPLAPLAVRFRELIKKAPEDALISVLAAEALFAETQNWREAKPLLKQVLGRGDLKGSLEAMALRVHLAVVGMEGIEIQTIEARYFEALTRSLTDGSYDEASHTVLLRHHLEAMNLTDFELPEVLETWSASIESSTLPEWLKLTLRGAGQKDLAWVKRSSRWADKVNDTQWQGFAEHLKSARDLLGQAARLRPDRPEAAAIMIAVAMGENVDPAELRSWFDRSVSAQLDYSPAYTALLWAYRPRWGGSHELMLAFGKACAATGRYETMVPSRLMVAAADVSGEVFDALAVFRDERVKSAMMEMSQRYLEAAATSPAQTRQLRQSNAALCAWLADDDQLAKKALQAAGPKLNLSTRQMLHDLLMHESMLRAEVAADVGDYGEAIKSAANPAPKTPVKTLHEMLKKIDETGLAPEALAYLKEARELTSLQEKIEAGGWVPLNFHQHLTGFYQTDGGEWSVEPGGTLVAHGTDHPRARLILRVPMGPNVEMKGEIAFDIPSTVVESQFGTGIGPMLHWLPNCTSGVLAMLFHLDATHGCTKAWCASMNNSTADIHFQSKEWSSFSIRAADGFLSYDVNERNMTQKHEMTKLGLEAESGLLGFGSYRLPIGSKARIRNVSIRKITADDLLPTKPAAVSKTRAARPVIASSSEPSTGKGSKLWQIGLLAVLVLLAIFIPRFLPSRE